MDSSHILRQAGMRDLDCINASLEFLHDKNATSHGVIRIGDIYSVLVEYYVNVAQRIEKASEIIDNMLKAGLKLEDYIDLKWITKVEALSGKLDARNDHPSAGTGRQSNAAVFSEDLIEEDIIF